MLVINPILFFTNIAFIQSSISTSSTNTILGVIGTQEASITIIITLTIILTREVGRIKINTF